MRPAARIETGTIATIPVLSASPIEADHLLLECIFSNHSDWTHPNSNWKLYRRLTLESALAALRENQIPIVICESDLHPGTWKDMLERTKLLPTPPLLIVTSRLADEYLWLEALNLGAYDVVAKPFDSHELTRIVSFAWLYWNDKYPTSQPKAMAAHGT
jgi:CheY-like chemotaxis protein